MGRARTRTARSGFERTFYMATWSKMENRIVISFHSPFINLQSFKRALTISTVLNQLVYSVLGNIDPVFFFYKVFVSAKFPTCFIEICPKWDKKCPKINPPKLNVRNFCKYNVCKDVKEFNWQKQNSARKSVTFIYFRLWRTLLIILAVSWRSVGAGFERF